MSFLRRFRARGRADEPAAEAFQRDLFTSRLAKPVVAGGLVVVGIGVAWLVNAVSPLAGIAAAAGVTVAVLVAVRLVDRPRWRGQDVLLWQQAGRERRWHEETGGPSPNQHPGQAETWLGTHPRGSVPQLYRVIAASLANDTVLYARELAAFEPAGDAEVAWSEWTIAAPRALVGEDVDLAGLRAAADALPEGDDRRQLHAGLAVAEALRRHRSHDAAWLEPLDAIRPAMRPERLRGSQAARVWLGRLGILLTFAITAVAFAASGFGTPDPFPRSYVQTTFATRGDLGDEDAFDMLRLAKALPGLAAGVATRDTIGRAPLDPFELDVAIGDGLPTIIWEVDAIDLAGPPGVTCAHVWSVEVLLGAADPSQGGAIVTCDGSRGRSWLVPVDPAIIEEIRAAVGLP